MSTRPFVGETIVNLAIARETIVNPKRLLGETIVNPTICWEKHCRLRPFAGEPLLTPPLLGNHCQTGRLPDDHLLWSDFRLFREKVKESPSKWDETSIPALRGECLLNTLKLMIDYHFPLLTGDEETLNERRLLTEVESGLMMNGPDSVRFLIVHCSATRSDHDYTVEQLLRDHKARGFRTIGYHFYIRRNGEWTQHRRLLEVGAHVRGYNRCSIGICYEGGLDSAGHPSDTRTVEQKQALRGLLGRLHTQFPHAFILGHRDLPGVRKACPCFEVGSEYVF